MPENEFEKKVSSEMQELRFKPSEKVWLQVEERIRKKNKRRVFLIIFLLAGLALLGYWQRDNLFGEKTNNIAKTETPVIKTTGEKQKATDETERTSGTKKNDDELKENNETKVDNKENQEQISERNISNTSPTNIAIPGPNKKVKQNKRNDLSRESVNNKQAQQKKSNEADITQVDESSKNISKKDALDIKVNDEISNVKRQEIKQPGEKFTENKTDSAGSTIPGREKKNVKTKDSASVKAPLKDSIAAVSKKVSSEKKWKWSVQLTPGISFLNKKGIPSIEKSAFRDYQSPAVSSGSAPPPPRQAPSEIKPGFAFQLGGFAQREISKRTNISFGLQYGFYSNNLGVGKRRDSLLNNNNFSNSQDAGFVYNAGGDTIHYTNRYHFIELPVRFQWQLNKNKIWPINWSAGFTVGRLIATNAIMYDTAFNGIYYQNKKLLNKTQFSLSTGFSFTIANNRRMQWSLGPFADIHLNKLVDNPFEDRKYLFFTGIRTSILFDQKK
jgi:hypothetical protein